MCHEFKCMNLLKEKKNRNLEYVLIFKEVFIKKLKIKTLKIYNNLQINTNDHTCINGSTIWLRGILSTTSFLGQKLDGNEEKGYVSQSSNLNPLERYSRPPCPWKCTL